MCQQVLKKISKYIQEQNEKIYAPRGLLLTDPLERGMRVVSFGHWDAEGMTRVRGYWAWVPGNWTSSSH